MFLLWVTFIWHIPQCVQIRNENEWHAEMKGRGFEIKLDLIPLFLSMYVHIFYELVRKQFLQW